MDLDRQHVFELKLYNSLIAESGAGRSDTIVLGPTNKHATLQRRVPLGGQTQFLQGEEAYLARLQFHAAGFYRHPIAMVGIDISSGHINVKTLIAHELRA